MKDLTPSNLVLLLNQLVNYWFVVIGDLSEVRWRSEPSLEALDLERCCCGFVLVLIQ